MLAVCCTAIDRGAGLQDSFRKVSGFVSEGTPLPPTVGLQLPQEQPHRWNYAENLVRMVGGHQDSRRALQQARLPPEQSILLLLLLRLKDWHIQD